MINVALDTKMMYPSGPIFHERSGSREEHKEHEEGNEGKHKRNTQTNRKKSHMC